MKKLYILLHPSGLVSVQATKPRFPESLHGWAELLPSEQNARALTRAAYYCDKGVDYDDA